MLIQKTFESWLQQFNSKINIRDIITTYVNKETGEKFKQKNRDVSVLYFGDKRLGSIPHGLKGVKGWQRINDKRNDSGYETSDGTPHVGMTGVGLMLMHQKIITPHQFVRHFTTRRNQEFLERLKRDNVISGY